MISYISRRALHRSSSFAALLESDIAFFRSFLPDSAVLTDPDDVAGYNRDWVGKFKGNSSLVLRPGSTEQVARILQHCNERKLAVVPQGGNTGLVGGSIPVFDEIVLSLSRLNRILHFDPLSGIVSAEAGVVKQQLDDFLQDQGYVLPYDLGARGSCQIGGNLATNAGGVRLIKYGSLRGSTVGLKAVMANGEVIDNMKGLLKDNTGYDLKQCLIGSEGTLGVITEAQILCPVLPRSQTVALLAVRNYESVLNVLRAAKQQLGSFLSAIEYLDINCLNLVTKQLKKEMPLSESPFYVVVEASSVEGGDRQVLEKLLAEDLGEEIEDGVLSQDGGQFAQLWEYRESIAEAGIRLGYNYKYDLSLPRPQFPELVEAVRKRCEGKAEVVGYGHVGDGNLHINVIIPGYDDKAVIKEVGGIIEPFIFDFVRDCSGSVSAEHGIGRTKPQYLGHSKSPEAVGVMRLMKESFDPQGILNPYKVFPTPEKRNKRFE